jgi:hypothetical protein
MPSLCNNPFHPLEGHDQEDETSAEASSVREDNLHNSNPLTTTTETSSGSSSLLSAQECMILPRKVQVALRKLRLAKKVLTDTSIQAEFESVLGAGSFASLSQEMLTGITPPAEESLDEEMEIVTPTVKTSTNAGQAVSPPLAEKQVQVLSKT